MNVKLSPRPINFNMNLYLSEGYELLKKEFVNIALATFLCLIMSIIPFCGFLAMGNLYKYLRDVKNHRPSSPGDIFNFDNFSTYFILQLIMIAGLFVLFIPMFFIFPGIMLLQNEIAGIGAGIFGFLYMIFIFVALFYFVLKGFYIPALFSLKGITDIKTAWKMSKIMTKGNLLMIFIFSIIVLILSQIGAIACGIGVLVTMPYMYTTHYIAFEDALKQIEYDEITEIGIKEKY
ncbi:hypothetical protein [Chryseobacterium sp.]|uniref:hypothetical protein n=1 Tax=Chryseobacterium sp. TaxID=1871047 RepID=UPI00389057ED